jgi:Flp pilus assembly protein TadG
MKMKPCTREDAQAGKTPGARRLSFGSQSGQVFALVAVGMVALVALGAFAIDVGSAYKSHRRVQAAADASALGAAQLLPTSTSNATAVANSLRVSNLSDGSINTPTYGSCYGVANTKVTVTANKSISGTLSKLLNGKVAHATATACVGSYSGWSMNIAPWAIPQQALVWAQTVQFKSDTAGQGNFGGTQLPVVQTSCGLGTGGNDYRYLINNTENSCLVSIGDQLNSKTGNLAGPTKQGLDERVVNGQHVISPNFCLTPDSCPILVKQTDGSYVLTTYQHPNLIVIPVVDQISNGSKPYTVVGFAWFIIQKYTAKTVEGMFIGSEAPGGAKCPTATDPNAGCPIGGYNSLGFKVIQLTG